MRTCLNDEAGFFLGRDLLDQQFAQAVDAVGFVATGDVSGQDAHGKPSGDPVGNYISSGEFPLELICFLSS